MRVFVFDLLPYAEHLDHLKQGRELPWPLPRRHFDAAVAFCRESSACLRSVMSINTPSSSASPSCVRTLALSSTHTSLPSVRLSRPSLSATDPVFFSSPMKASRSAVEK
jgi:hypothetical protein